MRKQQQLDFFDTLANSSLSRPTGRPVPIRSTPARPAAMRNSQTCSESNRNAAYRTSAPKRQTTKQMVLDYLIQCGERGATREEIEAATGLKQSSVCGRVASLLRPEDPLERPQAFQNGTKRMGSSGVEQVVVYAVDPQA